MSDDETIEPMVRRGRGRPRKEVSEARAEFYRQAGLREDLAGPIFESPAPAPVNSAFPGVNDSGLATLGAAYIYPSDPPQAEPVWVITTRRIQMPKHYFAMDLATDPKMQAGDRMLMKPEWAAIMIANGKVVRA